MKRCPQCNQTYTDDDLNYCLSDGTPLTIESEQITEEQTIAMQRPPARKKGKLMLWLGLTGLVLLVGGGVIVGLLIGRFSGQGESVRGERQNGANPPPSPALQPTSRVTPTPSSPNSSPVEESSPKNEGLKPTPNKEDTEDITPIAWDTTAAGFKGEDGQTYTFQCPKGGTAQAIYGSDVYTDYSSICTAAVHAGLISLADGGKVTIEYRPGRSIYGSTVRNGVVSTRRGTAAAASWFGRFERCVNESRWSCRPLNLLTLNFSKNILALNRTSYSFFSFFGIPPNHLTYEAYLIPRRIKMKRSNYLMFGIFAIILVTSVGISFAQSIDRDNPTPLGSSEISGSLNPNNLENFYSLTAGPGQRSDPLAQSQQCHPT